MICHTQNSLQFRPKMECSNLKMKETSQRSSVEEKILCSIFTRELSNIWLNKLIEPSWFATEICPWMNLMN